MKANKVQLEAAWKRLERERHAKPLPPPKIEDINGNLDAYLKKRVEQRLKNLKETHVDEDGVGSDSNKDEMHGSEPKKQKDEMETNKQKEKSKSTGNGLMTRLKKSKGLKKKMLKAVGLRLKDKSNPKKDIPIDAAGQGHDGAGSGSDKLKPETNADKGHESEAQRRWAERMERIKKEQEEEETQRLDGIRQREAKEQQERLDELMKHMTVKRIEDLHLDDGPQQKDEMTRHQTDKKQKKSKNNGLMNTLKSKSKGMKNKVLKTVGLRPKDKINAKKDITIDALSHGHDGAGDGGVELIADPKKLGKIKDNPRARSVDYANWNELGVEDVYQNEFVDGYLMDPQFEYQTDSGHAMDINMMAMCLSGLLVIFLLFCISFIFGGLIGYVKRNSEKTKRGQFYEFDHLSSS